MHDACKLLQNVLHLGWDSRRRNVYRMTSVHKDMWSLLLPPYWIHIFFASRISVYRKTWTIVNDESWVLVFHWPQGTTFLVTGIMGFVWCFWRRVALLFLIVCVVFFPTVVCITVVRCAQLILGKFLIVYRYSVLKSARDLLGYFFSWLFCSRDIFARSMSPGCSPSLFWNWHDLNLHAFEVKHPQRKFYPCSFQMRASKIYLIVSEFSGRR